jgi:hypothetical protein
MQRWFNTFMRQVDVLVSAFREMYAATNTVHRHITEVDAGLWAWIPGGQSALDDLAPAVARAVVATHCGALWHRDKVAAWQPGLVESSPATISALRELNRAKLHFKASVLSLRKEAGGQRLETLLRSLTTDRRRDAAVRKMLEETGMIGLDLRLCYRNFQCLDGGARAVSWTWIRKTTSVRKISHSDAVALAEKALEGDALLVALNRLASVPSSEMFAVRRPVATHLRANVWIGPGKPIGVVAHSPLFFPAGHGAPEKVWDYAPSVRPRLRRSDRLIDDEAFIHALSLHRYMKVASDQSPSES